MVRVGVLEVLGAAQCWLVGVPRCPVCLYVLRCQLDWWETIRLTPCVMDTGSPVMMTRARSPSPEAHGHLGMSRCYGLSLGLLTRYCLFFRPHHLMRFASKDAVFLSSGTREWLLRCSFRRQKRVLRRLFILEVEGGRPEYISSFPYKRCCGSTQQTVLPCAPLPPPHTKQSSSWVVRLQDTPHTLSIRHGGVPRQKQHVRTASARRTRRARGAPTVAVASPNRRTWGGRAMLGPAGRCPLSGL